MFFYVRTLRCMPNSPVNSKSLAICPSRDLMPLNVENISDIVAVNYREIYVVLDLWCSVCIKNYKKKKKKKNYNPLNN